MDGLDWRSGRGGPAPSAALHLLATAPYPRLLRLRETECWRDSSHVRVTGTSATALSSPHTQHTPHRLLLPPQVMWWIEKLAGRVSPDHAPPSYGLLGKKLIYGVDYGNYMHQLAAEIGAAPSLRALARKPRALIAYCLGQAYISFFRLEGPFATAQAWEVAQSELYRPVLQRGVVTNLIFVSVMFVFGSLSLALCVLEGAMTLPARVLAMLSVRKAEPIVKDV